MTGVEVDVKNIKDEDRHFVAATWSVEQGKIALYVDGNVEGSDLAKSQDIKYSSTQRPV